MARRYEKVILAKMDKTAVRKGLMRGLGFDGYLTAEKDMAEMLAPRKPYSLRDARQAQS